MFEDLKEWNCTVDSDLVSKECKRLVGVACTSTPGVVDPPDKQVHLGLAHVLAGLCLLKGNGVFRGVARNFLDQYFNDIFGRSN